MCEIKQNKQANLSRQSESDDSLYRYIKYYHLDCHLLNHTIQAKY